MKNFEDDFYKFLSKIKLNKYFSLSRWGDGELSILDGKFIDLREKGDGEFRFDPNLDEYTELRKKLFLSYNYNDDDYYIGIACPCCVGNEKFQYMKEKSNQDDEHLTWANLFVNGNYSKTVNEFIPELNNHIVNLVVNKNSKLNNLPFNINKVWYIDKDAWKDNYYLIDEIKKYIFDNNVKNEIFLFAAGPLANILTYELWVFCSKNNTYIDIGSILDPYLQLKLTRGYLLGANTLNKICIW